MVPHPEHVDSSAHFGYTMLPGSFVTKAQDDKLLEWANTIKSGFPLFVAAMDESNVSLNDCHVVSWIMFFRIISWLCKLLTLVVSFLVHAVHTVVARGAVQRGGGQDCSP